MLRAVVSETCSPEDHSDEADDYSSLLKIIGISVAIGAVGGQLIGHATQLLITGARKRMQARASSATASTHEQVQGEYESAGADAGVAAAAVTVPGYEDESAGADAGVAAAAVTEPGYDEAVRPTAPMTGAPGSFAEVLAAAASAATLPGHTTAEVFYTPPVPEPGSFAEVIAAAASAATLPGYTTAEAFYIPPVPQPASDCHWFSELGGSWATARDEWQRRVPAVILKDQRQTCRLCHRMPEESDFVTVTPHGECWHRRPDCSGMSSATTKSRRRPCQLCVG